jgi:glycosyltransferase involved in cell wall biosynthesis
MINKMKIVFAFRGTIRNSNFEAMSRTIVPIIEALPEDIKNRTTLYVGGVYNTQMNFSIKNVIFFFDFMQRLILFLNRKIFKLPHYKVYYLNERLYDIFLSLRINEPTVIISTTYLYKTIKKNKKLGGKNLLLAGNPDDFEIYSILKKEKNKYNLKFEDAYTYKPRVRYGLKSVSAFDHIITLNELQVESFTKRIPTEKVSCIHADIMPDYNRFLEKDIEKDKILTFCFVAHPFWLKGLIYLLEAWKEIDSLNCKLKIGGRIDEHLQKIIDERYYNLQNVQYTGEVKNMNFFLRSSHVCIIPSLLDASPRTVTEAMYCGLPVIVTDGCGNKGLINDGINGFIIPNGNSATIAEKMKWFVQNRDKISPMGIEARKTIQNLAEIDFKNVVNQLLYIIEKMQNK